MFIPIFSYFHISMQHYIHGYCSLRFIQEWSDFTTASSTWFFFFSRYVNFTWTEQVNFRFVSGVPLSHKKSPSAPFFFLSLQCLFLLFMSTSMVYVYIFKPIQAYAIYWYFMYIFSVSHSTRCRKSIDWFHFDDEINISIYIFSHQKQPRKRQRVRGRDQLRIFWVRYNNVLRWLYHVPFIVVVVSFCWFFWFWFLWFFCCGFSPFEDVRCDFERKWKIIRCQSPRTINGSGYGCEDESDDENEGGNCRKHFEWKCLWLLFLNVFVWAAYFSNMYV